MSMLQVHDAGTLSRRRYESHSKITPVHHPHRPNTPTTLPRHTVRREPHNLYLYYTYFPSNIYIYS